MRYPKLNAAAKIANAAPRRNREQPLPLRICFCVLPSPLFDGSRFPKGKPGGGGGFFDINVIQSESHLQRFKVLICPGLQTGLAHPFQVVSRVDALLKFECALPGVALLLV